MKNVQTISSKKHSLLQMQSWISSLQVSAAMPERLHDLGKQHPEG